MSESTMLSKPRVLVVDDEPLIGRALAYALFDCDVQIAHDPECALALMERDRFDVILTDLHLPGVSGLELWKRAASRCRELAQRFIFTTGGCSEAFGEAIREAGRPCLSKPFDLDQLRQIIADVSGEASASARTS